MNNQDQDNDSNKSAIFNVLRNKFLVQIIGKEIHTINITLNKYRHPLTYFGSYRFNNIPSLIWVVKKDTGSLLHDLCKRSPTTNQLGLSTLQAEWLTLDAVIAICSPHQYHKSITFNIETFDVIYNYYESAFKGEHFALDCAADSGNIQLVNYLISKGIPFTTSAIDNASKHGYLDIIKLLMDYNPRTNPYLFDDNVKFTNHSYDMAATNGHLNVLLYFDQLKDLYNQKKSKYLVDFTERAIDGAAKNNHFKVVDHILTKYGKDKKIKGYLFSEKALRWSIAHNNIEMHQKLTSFHHPDMNEMLKNDKWMIKALSFASEHGHLEVIKWVLTKKPFWDYLPHDFLSDSLNNRQHDAIEYFINHYKKEGNKSPAIRKRSLFYLENGIYRAIKLSWFEMYKELFELIGSNSGGEGESDGDIIRRILESACRHDNLEILDWTIINQGLHTRAVSSNYDTLMNGILSVSCLNGRLKIIKYLIEEKRLVVAESDHLDDCISSKCTECVEYIFSKITQRVSLREVALACRKGLPTIVRLFLSNTTLMENSNNNNNNNNNNKNSIIGNGLVNCFQEALTTASVECIIELEKYLLHPIYVTTKDITKAIENDNLQIVKHLFHQYSRTLTAQSLGTAEIERSLGLAIMFKYHYMVDFILGLRPPDILDGSDGESKIGLIELVPKNGYQVPQASYQGVVRDCDIELLEIIHRHRPYMKCLYPHDLLVQGYVNMFYKVEQWNNESKSDESPVEKPLLGPWYFRMVENGSIDLINYIFNVKKIEVSTIRLAYDVTPTNIVSIKTIMYILTDSYFEPFCTISVLRNFMKLATMKQDYYSGCKLLYEKSLECHGSVTFIMSHICQNANLTLLRLFHRVDKKAKSFQVKKFQTTRKIHKSIINYCQSNEPSFSIKDILFNRD